MNQNDKPVGNVLKRQLPSVGQGRAVEGSTGNPDNATYDVIRPDDTLILVGPEHYNDLDPLRGCIPIGMFAHFEWEFTAKRSLTDSAKVLGTIKRLMLASRRDLRQVMEDAYAQAVGEPSGPLNSFGVSVILRDEGRNMHKVVYFEKAREVSYKVSMERDWFMETMTFEGWYRDVTTETKERFTTEGADFQTFGCQYDNTFDAATSQQNALKPYTPGAEGAEDVYTINVARQDQVVRT